MAADLRQAEIARLEILLDALLPVFAQLPQDATMFDHGLVPLEKPRLFIDMIAFVEMARDRHTYRFMQEGRAGRTLIAESADVAPMAEAVTLYLGRRVVEREGRGARHGAGAIATQAWANLAYVSDGLALLASGASAQAAVDALTAADEHARDRQVGIVDAGGASASFTGEGCFPWAGGRTGSGYAIQGNILAGEEVVLAMETVWLGSGDLPLSRRLLAALAAGDAAGGDRRGRQSAALLVLSPGGGYGGGSDVEVDLRVDDHADPLPELVRLLGIHDLLFGRPAETLPLEGEPAVRLRAALDALGWTDPDLERSLLDCAGVENLEERMVPGRLDPVVLAYLEDRAAGRR